MTDPTATRMEAACSLLSKAERRVLLYQLADLERTTVDDLVSHIAAWEYDVDPAAVETEMRQRVYISLVHNHLPRLADYGIVDYDLRSGDIVLDEGFEDVRPLLEQFRQTESAPELRQQPSL